MNPGDLPEVVSELVIKVHEVHAKPKAINGRPDRIVGVASEIKLLRVALRNERKENTRRTAQSISRSFEPVLNRLLEHDDQLRNHAGRLNNLENPQQ
jgi:hypothetical protein